MTKKEKEKRIKLKDQLIDICDEMTLSIAYQDLDPEARIRAREMRNVYLLVIMLINEGVKLTDILRFAKYKIQDLEMDVIKPDCIKYLIYKRKAYEMVIKKIEEVD